MSVPVQAIYIFGTFSGGDNTGHPTDPTRPNPINTALPVQIQMSRATHLSISVTYQLDFPLTVTLAKPNGEIIYQIGGQAPDSIALMQVPDLILEGSAYDLRQMTITSTGRATVVLTAHNERLV